MYFGTKLHLTVFSRLPSQGAIHVFILRCWSVCPCQWNPSPDMISEQVSNFQQLLFSGKKKFFSIFFSPPILFLRFSTFLNASYHLSNFQILLKFFFTHEGGVGENLEFWFIACKIELPFAWIPVRFTVAPGCSMVRCFRAWAKCRNNVCVWGVGWKPEAEDRQR